MSHTNSGAAEEFQDVASIAPEQPKAQRRSRRRIFIKRNETPDGALTWRTAPQRSRLLWKWRRAVCKRFPDGSRLRGAAWAIEMACRKYGYAFFTDAHLAEDLNISRSHAQDALRRLEDSGAIVRASVFTEKGEAQRRIWPARAILGHDTADDSKTRHSVQHKTRLTPTMLNARKSAEIREKSGR